MTRKESIYIEWKIEWYIKKKEKEKQSHSYNKIKKIKTFFAKLLDLL